MVQKSRDAHVNVFVWRRWGGIFALYRAFLIEGKDWRLSHPYRRHARILDCFIKGWYSTNWTSERRQRLISSTLPMSLWQILQNCRDETAYSTTWPYEKASRTRTTLSRCWTPASPTGEPGVAVRRVRPRQTWSRCRLVVGTARSRQHARALSDNVHLQFHFQHNIITIRPSQLIDHNQSMHDNWHMVQICIVWLRASLSIKSYVEWLWDDYIYCFLSIHVFLPCTCIWQQMHTCVLCRTW